MTYHVRYPLSPRLFAAKLLVVSAPVLAGLPAMASEAAPAERHVEQITVTGTRLHDTAPAGVITIDRDAIARSGAATLSAVFRDLVFSAAGTVDEQFTQGFAPASAAANLRGLGVSRTLVLLDGRRLPIFPFAEGGSQSFVDLNLIPLGSIDRIEILKDGASAVYGADAVAGVVNIITHRPGGKTTVAARLSATAEGDGEEAYVTVNAGATLGEAEYGFGLDYLDRDPIWARDRELTRTANGPVDARSQVGNPGTFITSTGPVPDAACPADRLSGPFCTFDFAPDVTLVPGVERLGAYAGWDQAFTPAIGAFARVHFTTSDSERDLAAAPNAYPVSAANPNNPFGEDVLAIYRLNDLGPRVDRFESDAFNVTAGLSGTFDRWLWEVAAGSSTVDTRITGIDGYARAADVQAAIDSGVLNVFGPSPQFDPASIRFETEREGTSEITFFDVKFNGRFELGDLTVSSAFGAEYRSEEFDEQFDPTTASGAVIGVGGTSASGDRDVWAVSAEFGVPVSDALELVLAARYDNYSDFGGTLNPKLAVNYSVSERLDLRASIASGFKAPALHELHAGQVFAFASVFDTTQCDAARAASDAAGIAQYCDTVSEVASFASGNPDLDAEESDSLTVGAEWRVLDNWRLTTDYWRIENDNAVVSSAQFFIDNEARFASNVVRNGAGDIASVQSPFQNVAAQELWGVDVASRSEFELGRLGALDVDVEAAYLGSFEQAASPGEPAEELAGFDGYPEWRALAAATWSRDAASVTLSVNHTGGYERQTAKDDVDAWTRVNLQGTWTPEVLRGGAVSVGLDNVFDTEPPEDPFLQGFPFFNRALHDPRGRLLYLKYSHTL